MKVWKKFQMQTVFSSRTLQITQSAMTTAPVDDADSFALRNAAHIR
jgi:hypothetical protein